MITRDELIDFGNWIQDTAGDHDHTLTQRLVDIYLSEKSIKSSNDNVKSCSNCLEHNRLFNLLPCNMCNDYSKWKQDE